MSCREKNIHFNAGYNGCGDSIEILKNEVVQRDLADFEEMTSDDINLDSYIYVDNAGEPSKIKLGRVIANNMVQSDWDQEDTTKFDFIKNKPELKLEEDMVSLYNIGGVKIGQVFEKGTDIIDIVKEILTVDHPEVFYIGAIDTLAPDLVEEMREVEVSTAELISKGYKVKFNLDNQYFALAIPKTAGVEVKAIYQEGYSLGFRVIDLDSAWDLVVDENDVKGTGEFTLDYRFRMK